MQCTNGVGCTASASVLPLCVPVTGYDGYFWGQCAPFFQTCTTNCNACSNPNPDPLSCCARNTYSGCTNICSNNTSFYECLLNTSGISNTQNVPQGSFNGSPGCCYYQEVYFTDPTVGEPLCYASVGQEAGLMDVLMASFTLPGGQPITQLIASKLIPQCFDATVRQQENLYRVVHDECPSLLPWFSYSQPLDWTLGNGASFGTLSAQFPTRSAWQDTTFTRYCCTRPDQTTPGYDSFTSAPCDLMACYESAPCQYILEQPLADTTPSPQNGCSSNGVAIYDQLLDGSADCTRLMNWASPAATNPPIAPPSMINAPNTPIFPVIGAVATTVDIANSFIASFCATASFSPFYCEALRQTGGGNGLMFPRIIPQLQTPALASFPNTNTMIFSATNVSNKTFTNLQVYNPVPQTINVVLSSEALTLLPGESFAVTLTLLAGSTTQFEYTYSNQQTVNLQSINANWTCNYVSYTGPLPNGTNTISAYPPAPLCNFGDTPGVIIQVPYSLTNLPSITPASPSPLYWTFTSYTQKKTDQQCQIEQELIAPFGGPCPGCEFYPWNTDHSFPSCPAGIFNGWDGQCIAGQNYSMNLVTQQVCLGTQYPFFGFYFFDPTVWGSYANAERADFPLLGGFIAGQQFDFISDPSMQTTRLIAFPLTSEDVF